MQILIGLEALLQRGQSSLYKKLTTVCQNTQDALYEAKIASDEDVSKALLKTDFKNKILEVIVSETHFPISNVSVYKDPNPILQITLQTNRDYLKQTSPKTSGMMMEELHRLYDDRVGKIVDPMDTSKSPYGFKLVFYTGLWRVRDDEGNFYFTADEIAAGILHELGHADHWIRTYGRIQNRLLNASDIIDYIKSNPDPELVKNLIKAIKKSKYVNKSWNKIIEVIEQYFSTSNSLDDPVYYEALSTLTTLMASEIANASLKDLTLISQQAADKISTQTSIVDAERSADEFASRSGSYKSLMSFLSKLELLRGPKFADWYKQIAGERASKIVLMFEKFKSIFNVYPEDVADGYDPFIRRLELILETAKHAFHDDHLSPLDASYIKTQILEAEEILQKHKSPQRVLIKQWKINIEKFGRIVKAPFDNRLTKDYERLQESTRSLSRHPLYFLAHKE